MPLFELSKTEITGLERADFATLGLSERGDLQRLLRDHIHVIAPDCLVISEEFSSWDRSERRIDLLAVDRQARLVVVELKRTADDSFADLQALRYAAMVSRMTFDEAVDAYRRYLARRELEYDAAESMLSHFGWASPSDGRFGDDVSIVLAAMDFSPEVTSTILWLNERDLDITCVRIHPYRLGAATLIDVQQIIPLPEATDYQVQLRQKKRENRTVAEQSSDWTRYDVTTETVSLVDVPKRRVVLEAVVQLVHRGVTPEVIQKLVGGRIFEAVDGTVGSSEFREALPSRRPNDPRFVSRFFTADEHLIHVNDKTYALKTQWTRDSMEAALSAFAQQFGDYGFSAHPSGIDEPAV